MNKKAFPRRSFLQGGLAAAFGTAVAPMLSPALALGQDAPAAPAASAGGATIKIDFDRKLGTIDRNIYGNFTEHLGRCIYGGIYEPGSPLSDKDGFRKDVLEAARGIHIPL